MKKISKLLKSKRFKNGAIALSLICVMLLGGIAAYFTDADSKTNTFTVGKVDIELEEPGWVPPASTLPNDEVTKDPQIHNVGNSDAYVFVKVTVPYEDVVVADAEGNKLPSAKTELFTYDLNENWIQVGDAIEDEENNTISKIYAYARDNEMISLVKDATTPAVFESVVFANIVEGQGIEGHTKDVVVNAYAIQPTYLGDNSTSDPVEVWNILAKEMGIKSGPIAYRGTDGTEWTWQELLANTELSVMEDGTLTSDDGAGKDTSDRTKLQALSGKIIIPSSITSIKDWAFNACRNITDMTISNDMISIGDFAFATCTGLKNVTISSDTMSIGNRIFDGCTALTDVTFSGNATSFGNFIFNRCSSLTNVILPDGITSIRQNDFSSSHDLINIIIPDSVTSIEQMAFKDNTKLRSVTIPSRVTSIGALAFYGCNDLANITIPSSVTFIGNNAFRACNNLTNIIFENTSNWFFVDSEGYKGNAVTVTDSEKNAINMASVLMEDLHYLTDDLIRI